MKETCLNIYCVVQVNFSRFGDNLISHCSFYTGLEKFAAVRRGKTPCSPPFSTTVARLCSLKQTGIAAYEAYIEKLELVCTTLSIKSFEVIYAYMLLKVYTDLLRFLSLYWFLCIYLLMSSVFRGDMKKHPTFPGSHEQLPKQQVTLHFLPMCAKQLQIQQQWQSRISTEICSILCNVGMTR